MLGYGHDESAPTPDGMFAPHFEGVLWVFRGCSPRYRKPSAALSQTVRHVFRVCSPHIYCLNIMYL
ncbi:hypothetical protein [Prevotella pallens]|uniref:hypothetical protein n=1 Tax=Prevotella pallens TaxID=60133 RepID=UPI0028D70A48|nr:hypothetical protein [Prevotella pallens]